jgi:sugar O-acyltransferase (sialic acid O-acetyltransferase NeuD family)
MSESKPIAIFGSGEHARVVLDACICAGRSVAGFVDPHIRGGTLIDGLPILDDERQMADPGFYSTHDFLVAIGDQLIRERVAKELEAGGGTLTTVVHPRATVARATTLGPGTVVLAGAVINRGSDLGRFVIIHSNVVVDHDSLLEDGVQICPGAALAGRSTCERLAYIGTGATVIPGRRIGAHAVVGAGAVVIDDVTAGVTVVGNPARIVERGGLRE